MLFDVMNIIWDYDSVQSDSLPKSKCRSLCPVFHVPVVSYYILEDNLMYDFDSLGLCDLYFIAL